MGTIIDAKHRFAVQRQLPLPVPSASDRWAQPVLDNLNRDVLADAGLDCDEVTSDRDGSDLEVLGADGFWATKGPLGWSATRPVGLAAKDRVRVSDAAKARALSTEARASINESTWALPILDNLNRNVLAEAWRKALAEQRAEELANASPIPVVWPVGD